jgi:hypothetical protein
MFCYYILSFKIKHEALCSHIAIVTFKGLTNLIVRLPIYQDLIPSIPSSRKK